MPFPRESMPERTDLRALGDTGAQLQECCRLEVDSYRAEVQEIIQRKIREGLLRVIPMPGDPSRVRIIPLRSEL